MSIQNLKRIQRLYREYYALETDLEERVWNLTSQEEFDAESSRIYRRMYEIDELCKPLILEIETFYGQPKYQVLFKMGGFKLLEPYWDVVSGWGIVPMP